jgi:hypothetical protein
MKKNIPKIISVCCIIGAIAALLTSDTLAASWALIAFGGWMAVES